MATKSTKEYSPNWGGKREGSGKPKGKTTKVIRVPENFKWDDYERLKALEEIIQWYDENKKDTRDWTKAKEIIKLYKDL